MSSTKIFPLAILTGVLLLSGCNYPSASDTQKEAQALAPKQTMTALFAGEAIVTPIGSNPIAATEAGLTTAAPTQTQLPPSPTSTQIPPSETPLPPPTNTQVPPATETAPPPAPSATAMPAIVVIYPTNPADPYAGPVVAPGYSNSAGSNPTAAVVIGGVASVPTATFTSIPPTSVPPAATSISYSMGATAIPTSTPFPTVIVPTPLPSPTYVCDRALGAFNASFAAPPPVLDGDLSEWTATQYAIPYVVYGATRWSGDYDLSGTFQVEWDPYYLYLAIRVQDERYVQPNNNWEIYKGDSAELFFDSNYCGDYAEKEMNNDDFQIGFSPGYADINGIKEAYKWFPRPSELLSQVIIYAKRDREVVQYEIRIPWSALNVGIPLPGQQYGFVLSISDNDDPAQSTQETMISSSAHRAFNPMTWQMLYLK